MQFEKRKQTTKEEGFSEDMEPSVYSIQYRSDLSYLVILMI